MVKDPLTIADTVMFAMAWGRSLMRAHGFARDYYLKYLGAFITNEYGASDLAERVHWDADFAGRGGSEGPTTTVASDTPGWAIW